MTRTYLTTRPVTTGPSVAIGGGRHEMFSAVRLIRRRRQTLPVAGDVHRPLPDITRLPRMTMANHPSLVHLDLQKTSPPRGNIDGDHLHRGDLRGDGEATCRHLRNSVSTRQMRRIGDEVKGRAGTGKTSATGLSSSTS